MSDTGSPPPEGPRRSRLPRCCLLLALALGLPSLCLGGYAVYLYQAVRAPQPLSFEPFRYGPLERSLMTAKFEFLELPSRLLTGGAEPVEVWLSQRELNALLFGEASHDELTKARVLIEGDALRFEHSRPAEDAPQPEFINTSVRLTVTIGPEGTAVEVLDGRVGDYELGALLRGVVQSQLQAALVARRARDARLGRIRELTVEGGRARVVYQPERRR